MKKVKAVAAIILFGFIFALLVSCKAEPRAIDLLNELCATVGAEGIIYSPEVPEGEDGYITTELFSCIYLFYGVAPKNYAVMLNSRTDKSSECGVFICSDDAELSMALEMCLERLELLGAGDRALLIRSGNVVFYSSLSEPERVRSLWNKIIRSHT